MPLFFSFKKERTLENAWFSSASRSRLVHVKKDNAAGTTAHLARQLLYKEEPFHWNDTRPQITIQRSDCDLERRSSMIPLL